MLNAHFTEKTLYPQMRPKKVLLLFLLHAPSWTSAEGNNHLGVPLGIKHLLTD